MADIFIDCEWIRGDYLTILGAYSYGQDRFQLYERTLTRNRFSRFLNICSAGNPSTFLFCHGPDIGRIENYFELNLREIYYCINTQTAFRNFTNFGDVSLNHLEEYFRLPRRYMLPSYEIETLWASGREEDRRIVLEYNWEDCVNLWRLARILMREYDVAREDLRSIAMG